MSRLLFWIPRLMPLLMLLGGYWYVCEVNENGCSCLSKPNMPPSLAIADGDSVLYNQPQTFIRFPQSGATPIIPPQAEEAFPAIARYLNNNLNRQLKITCSYSPNEKNKTFMPDLGLARAELLKQKLVANGAPADRIFITSEQEPKTLFVRDYLIGGTQFTFMPNRLLPFTVEAMLQNDSVTVFFEGGTTRFTMPAETRIYLENLRQYLLQNPTAGILLTGHTDNQDTDEYNIRLGQNRCNVLMAYMVELGLPPNRISTISKGESSPAYPNTVEEGKMRNRRVVITTINTPPVSAN